MDAERKTIEGHEFWFVGTLSLRRSATGQLVEYSHVLDDDVRLNAHAAGPFCYFSLPQAPRSAGVYAIYVGGDLKYIGECEDVAGRFSSTGYGTISPRNCHKDGQSTNCKLNSRVLAAAKRGQVTEIWFHLTDQRKCVESDLIARLSPPWNGRETRSPGEIGRESPRRREASSGGTYGGGKTQEFRDALTEMLTEAARRGDVTATVRAGDLHKRVGGYPGPNHRMPVCCAAMRSLMGQDDRIVQQPPKGNGANLVIEYQLPRQSAQCS
jgi:hypothetical protein